MRPGTEQHLVQGPGQVTRVAPLIAAVEFHPSLKIGNVCTGCWFWRTVYARSTTNIARPYTPTVVLDDKEHLMPGKARIKTPFRYAQQGVIPVVTRERTSPSQTRQPKPPNNSPWHKFSRQHWLRCHRRSLQPKSSAQPRRQLRLRVGRGSIPRHNFDQTEQHSMQIVVLQIHARFSGYRWESLCP